MHLRSGYLTLSSFHGAPIRVHWTLPIGAFVLTGLSYVPGAWLGFALIVLVHELGHAVLVRAFRLRVVSIDLHGLGGQCSWVGGPTERQRAIIAWGGVLAQLVLLLTTPLWSARIPEPLPPFFAQLISAFTSTNMIIMLLNLLPVPPLDGAEAWRILRIGDLLLLGKTFALRRKMRAIQRQRDGLGKDKGKTMEKVIPFRKPGSDRSKPH